MKISEVITQARARITKTSWFQGSYFCASDGEVCMCAHGAIQATVNPIVLAILGEAPSPSRTSRSLALRLSAGAYAALAAAEVADDACVATLAAEAAAVEGATLAVATHAYAAAERGAALARARGAWEHFRPIWDGRPLWVRIAGDRGSLDAHFVCGLVGLTAGFNDAPSTAWEMVDAKFAEAIAFAKYLDI